MPLTWPRSENRLQFVWRRELGKLLRGDPTNIAQIGHGLPGCRSASAAAGGRHLAGGAAVLAPGFGIAPPCSPADRQIPGLEGVCSRNSDSGYQEARKRDGAPKALFAALARATGDRGNRQPAKDVQGEPAETSGAPREVWLHPSRECVRDTRRDNPAERSPEKGTLVIGGALRSRASPRMAGARSAASGSPQWRRRAPRRSSPRSGPGCGRR